MSAAGDLPGENARHVSATPFPQGRTFLAKTRLQVEKRRLVTLKVPGIDQGFADLLIVLMSKFVGAKLGQQHLRYHVVAASVARNKTCAVR
jgi:hypothetical protein